MQSCRRFGCSTGWIGRRERKQAFTLIELLVVIAIIAILAAILFPVFGRARENARRSSCSSNLKQMGTAFIMYTQDYDERFPMFENCGVYGSGVNPDANNPPDGIIWDPVDNPVCLYWQQMLFPYTKNQQIYDCPSGLTEFQSIDASTKYRASYGATGYCIHKRGQYGANTYIMFTTSKGSPGEQVLKLSVIQNPANIYAMMDSSQYYIEPGLVTGPYVYPGKGYYLPGTEQFINPDPVMPSTSWDRDYKYGRHFGGVNVAFCDGHVKFQKSSDVFTQAQLDKAGKASSWDPKKN